MARSIILDMVSNMTWLTVEVSVQPRLYLSMNFLCMFACSVKIYGTGGINNCFSFKKITRITTLNTVTYYYDRQSRS